MRTDSDQPTLFAWSPAEQPARCARRRKKVRRSQRQVSHPHHATSVAAPETPGTTCRASNAGFFRSPVLALIEGQCELLFALPDDAALLGRGAIHLAHIAEALSGATIPATEQERLADKAWWLVDNLLERSAHLGDRVIPEVRRCYGAAEALADHGAAA